MCPQVPVAGVSLWRRLQPWQPSHLQVFHSFHSLWPRGDPSPRRGAAPEETLLRIQQVVPSRGQHLGRGAGPLRAVHRPAHRCGKRDLFVPPRPALARLRPRERLCCMWALLADPGVGWEGSALSSDHADRAGYSCEQLIIKVDPLLFIYYRQNPQISYQNSWE